MNIKFTLLIATLNRPETLKTCVKSLLKQTYDNYEIIIVDQSDNDYRDSSIATLDSSINYIHIDEKGLSHARNIGLNYVSGDYVCLIDDDAIYEETYLSKSAEIISRLNPTILIGLLFDPFTKEPVSDLHDCEIQWKNLFKGLCSACLIIASQFLKSVKFDERFGVGSTYGSGEESDVLMKALKQKKVIYFTMELKIYHSFPPINEIPLQKVASYSYGLGALYKKTIKNYSKLWGFYYFTRTLIGNYGLWIVQSLRKNYIAAEARKVRALYMVKGFINYK